MRRTSGRCACLDSSRAFRRAHLAVRAAIPFEFARPTHRFAAISSIRQSGARGAAERSVSRRSAPAGGIGLLPGAHQVTSSVPACSSSPAATGRRGRAQLANSWSASKARCRPLSAKVLRETRKTATQNSRPSGGVPRSSASVEDNPRVAGARARRDHRGDVLPAKP